MESNKANDHEEIDFDFPPFLRVYRDGRAMRLLESDFVPPSVDPSTGVSSKDVVIDPTIKLSARVYLPSNVVTTDPDQKKLPLLIYFHGGGFCIETAFSTFYHQYLNSLVAEANVVAVSVDYRKAPEHPVPIAHEDSWVALKWVLSHFNGEGPESWITTYADSNRVFLAGDSAGANIAHNMAIRAGVASEDSLCGVKKFSGIVVVNPYFAGVEPIGKEGIDMKKKELSDKLWLHICPSSATNGWCDDPLINPATDTNLSRLGCKRVLICVAEKDGLRDRGWFYYETLVKSGWDGVAEIMETEDEDHVFHLFKPTCEKAKVLMKRLASYLNQDP